MNKAITDMTDKAEALSRHLGANINEIILSDPDQCLFEFNSEEYLVCTEDEAYEKACEYMKESLWAFNARFLIGYMHGLNGMTEREMSEFESILKGMQEKMCEGCNLVITLLIRERLEKLMQDAISTDGIAHFLAGYDHKEREEGRYFIYRTN